MDMEMIRKYAGLTESAPVIKSKKPSLTVGKDALAFTAGGLFKFVSEKATHLHGSLAIGTKIAESIVWKLMAEHNVEISEDEMNKIILEVEDRKFALRFGGMGIDSRTPAEIIAGLMFEKLSALGVPLDEATINKLVEMQDDDDDMSPAEKELAAKAESDLKKKGIKVKNFDADAVVGKTSADKAEKMANNAETEKKDDAPAKSEETAGEKAAEAKKRGRSLSADSKNGKARAWLAANAGATRGQFVTFADATLGMSKAHASTIFYLLKKRLNEGWVLSHPTSGKFVLGENKLTGNYAWNELDSDVEPAIFETEEAAQKIATFMTDYRSTVSVITRINLDEGMMDKIKQVASDVEDKVRGNFRQQGTRVAVAKKAIVKAGSDVENKLRGIPS